MDCRARLACIDAREMSWALRGNTVVLCFYDTAPTPCKCGAVRKLPRREAVLLREAGQNVDRRQPRPSIGEFREHGFIDLAIDPLHEIFLLLARQETMNESLLDHRQQIPAGQSRA